MNYINDDMRHFYNEEEAETVVQVIESLLRPHGDLLKGDIYS